MKEISASGSQAPLAHEAPSCSSLEDGRWFWRRPTWAFPHFIRFPNPAAAGARMVAYMAPWSEPAQPSSRRRSGAGVVQLLLPRFVKGWVTTRGERSRVTNRVQEPERVSHAVRGVTGLERGQDCWHRGRSHPEPGCLPAPCQLGHDAFLSEKGSVQLRNAS